jgi:hypothetical protein
MFKIFLGDFAMVFSYFKLFFGSNLGYLAEEMQHFLVSFPAL